MDALVTKGFTAGAAATTGLDVSAVIFDLDGVIVTTDEYHYLAWARMAEQEGIPFNREVNNRLRGISRMESLDIIVEQAERAYTDVEKTQLAEQKNGYYRQYLNGLTERDLLPGVIRTLHELKRRGIQIAIGSSSKNTPLILRQVGLETAFDAVADGNEIANSKPHPEVFLLAAEKLGANPASCLVVEDAEAGIDAALRAGMRTAAIGEACSCSRAHLRLTKIDDVLEYVGSR